MLSANMPRRPWVRVLGLLLAGAVGCSDQAPAPPSAPNEPGSPAQGTADLDVTLRLLLAKHRFTGRIAETLERRLGRPIDRQLADIGRQLWFDPIQGLNDDNSCGGCHSPTNGLGDTQPIAIGIDNNGVVGPGRSGPRNQRRTPMVLNTVFYPALMWNSRFHAVSRDPFDNGRGFVFPAPEGRSLSYLPHLLTAQAFIPPTERTEAAGVHFPGGNAEIRSEVVRRLNASDGYRALFARVVPWVRNGAPITYDDVARAIAEFEFSLVFANAPIDRFARGAHDAMTPSAKRGAVLFFGKAGCVGCHAVSGASNEMFSDFTPHVAAVPQVVPSSGNVPFDGPGANEDFGLEQVTGSPSDRYAFRTAPLRNVALQPAFMHNGAFVRLEDAIRYHLDAHEGAKTFSTARLPSDLQGPTGPSGPVLERLDRRLRQPVRLSTDEFNALVDFVRDALLDPDAAPPKLRGLVPEKLPSGRRGFVFQFGRAVQPATDQPGP